MLHEKPETNLLKVSTQSNPNSIAGAIAGMIKDYDTIEMQVVGARALNQAIKGIAIARGFITPTGIDVVCIPTFISIQIDGVEKTGIKLIVRRV